MESSYEPTLCFGTLFILLSQSRKNLGCRKEDEYDKALRAITEKELFNALQNIVYGKDIYEISTGLNSYKNCTRNKTVPCQETTVREAFRERLQRSKSTVIDDINKKLMPLLDQEKDEQLVKLIIVLLNTAVKDKKNTAQIDNDVLFYINSTEQRSKSSLINDVNNINLPYFLLDVYSWVITNCIDNRIGKATYDMWCPKIEGELATSQRPFIKGPDITKITRKIQVFRQPLSLIKNSNEEISAELYPYDNTDLTTHSKFKFLFTIDKQGVACSFTQATKNALLDWFYDYARAELSDCSDEDLINTFDVEILDERILNNESKFNEIEFRMHNGETLSEQDEHIFACYKKQKNHTAKCIRMKTEALKIFLSDRSNHSVFYVFDYVDLEDVILKILNFRYDELYTYPPKTEPIDVFLNINGNNHKKHEQFIAFIYKEHLKEIFGNYDVYDLYGRSFLDLGKYRREVAPYFYFHIAELINDNFDFSMDKRVTGLLNYWIGLH